jgi:hypothetical protein
MTHRDRRLTHLRDSDAPLDARDRVLNMKGSLWQRDAHGDKRSATIDLRGIVT